MATKKKRGRPKKVKTKVATKPKAPSTPPDPVSAKVVGAKQPPKLASDRLHDYGDYNPLLYVEDVLHGMSNVFGINRGLVTKRSRDQLKSIVAEHYPLMVKSDLRLLIETREIQIFALVPSHAQKRYKQCLALFDYFATFQYRAAMPEVKSGRPPLIVDDPESKSPCTDPEGFTEKIYETPPVVPMEMVGGKSEAPDDDTNDVPVAANSDAAAESAGAPQEESQEFCDSVANITAPFPLLDTNEKSAAANEQQAETLPPENQIDVPLDGPVQYRCGNCGNTMDGLSTECPHCGADTEASDAMPVKANGVASDGGAPPD